MEPLTVGVRSDSYDYSPTAICLQSALDRQQRGMCNNISGMLTKNVATLMFFQVSMIVLIERDWVFETLQGLPVLPVSINVSIGIRLPNGTWTGALGLLQSGVVDI